MRRSMVAAVWMMLLAIPAGAAVIHVPGDQPTIQAGIAAAALGDIVQIAAGTYTEPMQETPAGPSMLVLPPGVSLIGEGEVVLDAAGAGRILYLSPGWWAQPINRLESLILRHGFAEGSGGAMYVPYAAVTVTGVRFEDNQATVAGGAFRCDFGTIWIEDSHFTGNVAEDGGALSNGSSGFNMRSCVFTDDTASPGGGAAFHFRGDLLAEIHDCFVQGCRSRWGSWAKLEDGATVMFIGCSFISGRETVMDTGIHLYANSTLGLSSSILTGARGRAIVFHDVAWAGLSDCNDIWGNGLDYPAEIAHWLGTYGNFSADPLFCSPSGGDYHLSSLSPCAPDNNECGLQVGALPVACETTATAPASWGAIKSLY